MQQAHTTPKDIEAHWQRGEALKKTNYVHCTSQAIKDIPVRKCTPHTHTHADTCGTQTLTHADTCGTQTPHMQSLA